jgi:cholesterol transport system auxiliary component
MNSRFELRTLLAVVMALAMVACSGLRSSTPPTQTYLLQPQTSARTSVAAVASAVANAPAAADVAPSASLAVVLPAVAPGLDSERISLIHPDGRLDSFAGSRWPDALPLVLHPLIVDALRAGGQYRIVQSDATPFNADYLLQVEVRQFAIEYDAAGNPAATVALVCTLGSRAERAPVRSFTTTNTVAATANRMAAVVAAFNQALTEALQQMVSQANP